MHGIVVASAPEGSQTAQEGDWPLWFREWNVEVLTCQLGDNGETAAMTISTAAARQDTCIADYE